MSKLKKLFLTTTALFCSFFVLTACSESKIADKPENSAVYDQAKVLSKETIQTIDKLNEKADNTDKKLKIGVYIAKDLDGKSVEETALEIARKWKIGDKDTNNGVLLFLAINDKKSRLEVSDNLSTQLTDIQSKTILDNMKPKLRNDDYDGAVLDAVKSITDANDGKTIKENKDNDNMTLYIVGGLILIVIIGIVVLFAIDSGGGFGGNSDGFWFSSGGSGGSSGGGGFSGGGFSGGGASSGW